MPGNPRIEQVKPAAAIPGGEVTISGTDSAAEIITGRRVRFGTAEANLIMAAENYLIARVPEGAAGGAVRIKLGDRRKPAVSDFARRANCRQSSLRFKSRVDSAGNVYVTFSGQRGQKVPVSLYKVTAGNAVKPFVTELMNPTGLALDAEGMLYVSCRNDGTIHRISPDGRSMQWMEGMGIATGLAFDKQGSLYVGDRSGTIFKISPEREIFVFATLEPSVAAYHLAFGPNGDLYVTGPTTSSFDRVYRITPAGEVNVFYRGLGRPQGLAFDRKGNLVCRSVARWASRRRAADPQAKADVVLGGNGIVGLALMPTCRAIVATNNTLYTVDWDVEGQALYG